MTKHPRIDILIGVAVTVLLVTGSLAISQRQPAAPQNTPAPPPPLEIEGPPPAERSVPQTAAPPKPDESFTMLANPEIATRMGLSDEQIVKVQSLIVERSQKLKDAPQDQWDGIRVENEAKLKAVLTPEQQANWLKVIHEKTIVIIFKDQSWAEVLNWFANQLGLQLIMGDAPPPGTFSYADRKEYSPAEALDKLNSVLQARGYTLVRSENLLHLFNLKNTTHIPLIYLPKLKPEDLDERKANFEFVAVTYQLGRRDRKAIDEQLKFFLGRNSQVIDLQGNAFMLVDTVASQRIVKKLIESIKEPEPAGRAPGTPPPDPTNWQTYVIEKTDPAKVEEIVKTFCGITQMVRLPNSPQLHVLGTEDQQKSVRQVIDRIEVDPGTTHAPTVEVYSLDQLAEATPQQLWALYSYYGFQANLFDVNASFINEFLKIVKEVVPNAMTTYEKNNRKLVVLATPEDQKKVADLVEKLKRSALAENAPLIKVYKLTNGSPSFIKDMVENVKKLVPKAIIDFNTADRCLLVVGTADEHKMITDTIKELDTISPDDIERKMVCYPVNQVLLSRFNTLWRQLSKQPEFEGVLELSEGRDNQLTIWATTEQHVRLKSVLNELLGGDVAMGDGDGTGTENGDGTATGKTVSSKLVTKSFVVRRGDVSSLRYVLPQVIPGISVMPDYQTNSILVFGTQDAVDSVEDFVNKIDAEFGIGVLVMSLDEKMPDDVLNALRMMFRRYGSVMFDEKNMRLIAYGAKGDLAQIEQVVTAFKKSHTEEPKSIYVQPVERTMPEHVVEFVRDAVPHADIQYDQENKRFTIAGTKTDQLLASKLILEAELSLPPRERIKLFPVGQLITDDLITTIKTNVDYIADIKRDEQDPMRLYVKARPTVLDEVERLLEDIKVQMTETALNSLVGYPVTPTERSRFDKLQDDLKKQIGEFRILDDDRKNILSIWALPQQHERIAAMLKSIQTEAPAELQEQIVMHTIRFTESETLQQLVRDIYPDIDIREDKTNNRLILRVPKQNAEAVKLLLSQVDTQDPDRVKRYFASYPVGSVNMIGSDGGYRNYYHLLQQLQPMAPNAKLSFDYVNSAVIVWGTDEEQAVIKETIENVHNTEPADRFGRFPIRRAEPYTLMAIVQRMFPASPIQYDTPGKTLVVQGTNAQQLKMIGELIKKLDPEEPGPNDMQVQFYQLSAAAPPFLISTLQRLAPEAYVVPDDVNRQLMVLARPAEHDLIRKNVDLIVSTFTPDEPVLFVYSVTDDQRKGIEAFVKTAETELRGLRIVEDTRPGRMAIWAKPLEHQLVNDALIMMSTNTDAGFELEFKVFSLTAVDAETVEKALTLRVPEAKPIFDEKGMRMLVWASKSDMAKVTQTFETLDPTSTKNLKYMTYPVAIGEPEAVLEAIKQVYPNIKSTVDDRNKRLLIWATPEEHAAIAEMIEKTNTDSGITLQERYQSFPIPKLSYVSVQAMLKALFPGTEVYGDALPPRMDALPHVTVRATARELEQIKALLEQMQSTDDKYHAEFAIYPMGDADPVTLEAMLQGMFPNAESLTGYEIKNLLQEDPNRMQRMRGWWYPDMPMSRVQRQLEARTGTREGCFKVDQATRSVFVFLPESDQKKIASAIESLVKASELSGGKIVKSYPLMGYFWSVYPILEESFPGVKITRGADYTSVIVVATELEHQRFAQFIKEYNQISSERPYIYPKLYTIPDGTNVSRSNIIRSIWQTVNMSYPTNGAQPNQILVMTNRQEEPLIQELIDEFARERKPEETITPEVYVLKYITVTDATNYLKTVAPNALFGTDEPEEDNWYWPSRPRRTPAPDTSGTQRLVVRATPKDHLAVKEALAVLDVDLPEELKPVPRDYSFANYHPSVIYTGYRSLLQAFPAPKATFSPQYEQRSIVAVASPQTHKEIDDFIKTYFEQKEAELPKIEVYALGKTRFVQIRPLLQESFPWARIVQGVTPDQMIVYARPIDQQKIVEVIAKLQTMTVPENAMQLKAYHVPPAGLTTTSTILQSQIVGGFAWPNYTNSTIIVYGSENEHAIAAKVTESMGESFPEQVTQTYFTKNIPIGHAVMFLSSQFATRATIYHRPDTGDLIATATPDIHEEIRKTIDAIDVPRPVESEKIAVVYDLSDIPPEWFYGWTLQTIMAVSPAHLGTLILPTHVPGQIAVYATPVEQAKIKKVVDEMLAKNAATQGVTENYEIKYMAATTAWTQFLAKLAPNARVGFNVTDPHKMTVWDKPSAHEKLAEAIAKLNEDDKKSAIAQMYRFQRITLATALQLMTTHFPGATFSQDLGTNSLVATATREEQAKIAAMAVEIDKYDPKTQSTVKIHNTGTVSAYQLSQALNLFYPATALPGQHFRAVTDVTGRSLIVTATPQQHEQIASLIDQMAQGGLKDPSIKLEIYDLEKLNPWTVQMAIWRFFSTEGVEFNPSYDSMSGKMMVLAKPQEHAAIRMIMDSFKTEERELVIFTLRELDPESVQMMVNQLFYEDPYSKRPTIQVDYYSDMLYIRATKSQQEKIRELLAKFGETGELQPTLSPVGYRPGAAGTEPVGTTPAGGVSTGVTVQTPLVTGSDTFRTIQFDGNADELIEKLQKIWPQINPDNPLKVLNKEGEPQPTQPATPSSTPSTSTTPAPATPSPGYHAPEGMSGTDGPWVIELDDRILNATLIPEWDMIAYTSYAEPVSPMQDVPFLSGTPNPAPKPAATSPQTALPTAASQQTAAPQPATAAPTQPAATAEVPATQATPTITAIPVYLIVNQDGTMSVVSEDTAALDRLTAALAAEHKEATEAARFNRIVHEEREYTEYAIRNLAPTVLSARLQMRMTSRFPNRLPATQPGQSGGRRGGGLAGYNPYGGFGGGFGDTRPPMPQLNPQDMSNTLIVTGSKRDRAIVAEMIEELDVPDPIYYPFHVRVENSEALKVYQELLSAYGRLIQNTRLPNGMRPYVTVEQSTNSIVIQGPDDLVQTLTKYIKETDKTLLAHPPKKIHVIPLPMNSTVFNVALQELYRSNYPMITPFGMPMYQQNYGGYTMPGYGGYTTPGYTQPYVRRPY